MTNQTTASSEILRDLGNGLIMRRATEADIPTIVAMNTEIFEANAGAVVRAFLLGELPYGERDLFTVVEDTASGEIVSSLCLLAKTGTYDGIPFGIGQPEFVLTRPAYRGRGLIRAQMEQVHTWSAARGDVMQIIGGIPFYYRQFGYDMALDMGAARIGFKSYLPKLKEGETEPFRVRFAQETDADFITATYQHGSQRYMVTNTVDAATWRSVIRRSLGGDPHRTLYAIIEDRDGQSVGFFAHTSQLRGDHQMAVWVYELAPGVSWLAVTPSIVRYVCATGEEYATRDSKQFGTFNFTVGPDHPVFAVIDDLLPRSLPPYAWYVRIPDLCGFLRLITPVLEQRLARSYLPGHTGELKLSLYRDGLRLVFTAGKIVAVEPWLPSPEVGQGGDAAFPELTFLQLLLGMHTLAELEQVRPDCWHEGDAARAVLNALFPKRPSNFAL